MAKKTDAQEWRVHVLKSWPHHFREVLLQRKWSEFRVHDRDFKVGDILLLKEWDPKTREYTGRELQRKIRYLYSPEQASTFVVLEIEVVEP